MSLVCNKGIDRYLTLRDLNKNSLGHKYIYPFLSGVLAYFSKAFINFSVASLSESAQLQTPLQFLCSANILPESNPALYIACSLLFIL